MLAAAWLGAAVCGAAGGGPGGGLASCAPLGCVATRAFCRRPASRRAVGAVTTTGRSDSCPPPALVGGAASAGAAAGLLSLSPGLADSDGAAPPGLVAASCARVAGVAVTHKGNITASHNASDVEKRSDDILHFP